MVKQNIAKYINFIQDDEFLEHFIPNIKSYKTKSEPIESFVFSQSPGYINAELRDYQIQGLNWLIKMHESHINCILADEMGLGKTLQCISLLGYIRYMKGERSKHLVIVPKSVLGNWYNEFKKFIPALKVKIYHTARNEVRGVGKEIIHKRYDVVLTTYEMCLTAKSILKKVKWEYVIVDEAHRLKNENSLLSKVLRIFPNNHRLLLTGTPLQNNVHELWALLNFIIPDIFFDVEKFEEYVLQAQSDEKVDKIRSLLQLFFLRREKDDVEKSLLPKKIVNLYHPLTTLQKDWYKSVLKKDLSGIVQSQTKMQLLNIVVQLRKVANHPYLFPGAEPQPLESGEHLITNSGKMILLDKLLKRAKENGSRVLIFSQMSMMLDIMEDYVIMREYEYCRIDGNTPGDERVEQIDDFNSENSDKFVFLLTTRAGGLGINLYTADTVIIYDSDWNPQMDLQAQDRAHRIGQRKQVNVFRLITSGSIEESIVFRAQQKLKLDETLIQKGEKVRNNISAKELMGMLADGLGIPDKEENEFSIEEILQMGYEKTQKMNEKIDSMAIGESEQFNHYKFEGEDYKAKISNYIKENKIAPVETPIPAKRKSLFTRRVFNELNFPEHQFYPSEFYVLQKKEKKLFDKEEDLSEKDQERKKELLSQGFDWLKKDYRMFLSSLEMYGENVDAIKKVMNHKDDVERYYKVFFERLDELNEADRIRSMLEKGRVRLEKVREFKKLYDANRETIEQSLKVNNKMWVDSMYLLGLYYKNAEYPNCYERIHEDIVSEGYSDFDYFLLSRGVIELTRQISSLINQVHKICQNN